MTTRCVRDALIRLRSPSHTGVCVLKALPSQSPQLAIDRADPNDQHHMHVLVRDASTSVLVHMCLFPECVAVLE